MNCKHCGQPLPKQEQKVPEKVYMRVHRKKIGFTKMGTTAQPCKFMRFWEGGAYLYLSEEDARGNNVFNEPLVYECRLIKK
jgi:hypothetical protein